MKSEYEEAVEVLVASRRALEGFETKLIGSLFADNHLYDGLEPRRMVELAKDSQCDGFLIDTLTKDGRNLFDFLSEEELRDIVYEGKLLGMSTALSGHLRIDDLDELARINPDIVGVRGAVCARGRPRQGGALGGRGGVQAAAPRRARRARSPCSATPRPPSPRTGTPAAGR